MAKEVKENKVEVLNPFDNGVNYKMFLESLGSTKLEDYCKANLSDEQSAFLIEDLKHYKQK
jgi:hypothetical protein